MSYKDDLEKLDFGATGTEGSTTEVTPDDLDAAVGLKVIKKDTRIVPNEVKIADAGYAQSEGTILGNCILKILCAYSQAQLMILKDSLSAVLLYIDAEIVRYKFLLYQQFFLSNILRAEGEELRQKLLLIYDTADPILGRFRIADLVASCPLVGDLVGLLRDLLNSSLLDDIIEAVAQATRYEQYLRYLIQKFEDYKAIINSYLAAIDTLLEDSTICGKLK